VSARSMPAAAAFMNSGSSPIDPVAVRESTAEPERDLRDVFEAARRGDRSSFEELYQRFARVVHGVILARVGTREAEDLTQESFMSIYRGIEAVRDLESLPAWICTVARNTATDHLRRKLRRPYHEVLSEMPAKRRPDDAAELRADVLAMICSLPDAYRETLVMRLVEGLTGPEIAERTGLTPGSVRVNLSRGMALLRPLLRKEGWS